jgi:hypothetical protein
LCQIRRVGVVPGGGSSQSVRHQATPFVLSACPRPNRVLRVQEEASRCLTYVALLARVYSLLCSGCSPCVPLCVHPVERHFCRPCLCPQPRSDLVLVHAWTTRTSVFCDPLPGAPKERGEGTVRLLDDQDLDDAEHTVGGQALPPAALKAMYPCVMRILHNTLAPILSRGPLVQGRGGGGGERELPS